MNSKEKRLAIEKCFNSLILLFEKPVLIITGRLLSPGLENGIKFDSRLN
jgi:hypothetical protein